MRSLRAAVFPVLLMLALVFLSCLSFELPSISHFEFIWDVLIGGALGAGLAFLPTIAGFEGKRNPLGSKLWIAAFVTMLLVFYQYISLVTRIQLHLLPFLENPGARMRIVEGALLGFLSFAAGRSRV